jgi:hypothetical protein
VAVAEQRVVFHIMFGITETDRIKSGCTDSVSTGASQTAHAAAFVELAAQRRNTTVVVKSTFLVVVEDEEREAHLERRARRSSTDPASQTRRAMDKIGSCSDVYFLEGAKWQKCAQTIADSNSTPPTIPSSTSSLDFDEEGYVSSSAPFGVTTTPASSVVFDETNSLTSDDEVPSDVHPLWRLHSRDDGSEHMRKPTLRFRSLQTVPNCVTAVQEHFHSHAHSKTSVIPEAFPISAVYMCPWFQPAAFVEPSVTQSHAATPMLSPFKHPVDYLAHANDVGGNCDHQRTTVIVRNLPNSYNRDLIIELLNAHGGTAKYDFLYFPVDFQTGSGLGFAFVNFVTHMDACLVKDRLDGFRKWVIPSSKICAVGWSGNDQQGVNANIERYRNNSVMHKSVPDSSKPVVFENGVRMKFPSSTKKLWPPSRVHGSRVKKLGATKR